ncbi:MAG: ubiquinone biosynthesis monooxygenase Coq7 [Gammaproteobacteria bacterium]|jgi:ubiquinone biosynthesis monooxygenase Coq7
MLQKLNLIDTLLDEFQHGLKTCQLRPHTQARPYPGTSVDESNLSDTDRKHAAGLMRVNNAGEVAAQGLYRGQAFSARDPEICAAMQNASEEENEHLNWCQQRLSELGQNRSKLDGLWYLGSFAIGSIAGTIGDKWSLGFVEETEKQVTKHLENHLTELPERDQRSKVILQTMRVDEMQHAINAHNAGAAKLPGVIRQSMTLVSKIMTFSAYRF